MTYYNSESLDKREVDKILRPTMFDNIGTFLKYFVIVFSVISLGYGMIKWGISEKVRVEGNSMYPALQDGQEIYIQKFLTKFTGFKRGQIIVINDKTKLLIKRVIGLSNETIELKNKEVIIYNNFNQSGIKLIEEYIPSDANMIQYPTCKIPDCSKEYDKVKIGDNEVFVLGDNRIESKDSRSYGPINKNNIIGVLTETDIKERSKFILPKYNLSNY